MNIVYSFIFYFVTLMFGLTFCLTIFVLKPARTLLYSLRIRFGQIFANEFFVYSIYLIFAIIILILGESILNFSALKNYFRKSNHRIRQDRSTVRTPSDSMTSQLCPKARNRPILSSSSNTESTICPKGILCSP